MRTTQKDRIINYIRQFGSISSWEAYADLGITQLGARIDQLKKEGYEFKTEWESNTNRFGEKTDYKRYYLADIIAENMEHITRYLEVVMIIVSQDKMEIFNFEEIFRLYVDNWSNEEFATEPNCFCIKAEKSSDNMICAFLGEYKTEERAKEVLQEIIKSYRYYRTAECDGYTNVLQETAVFEMPED